MAQKHTFHYLLLLLISTSFTSALSPTNYPQNCQQIEENGVHTIRIDKESRPFQAYCEHNTYGSGWTVILNRFDGSVDFSQRACQHYKFGFGDCSREFFLGLDKINALTSVQNHMLLVLMTDFNNTEYISTYDTFIVWDETFEYSTGDSTTANSGIDAGFTKWNAFCTACSKVRCMNDIPGWQLNPFLEPKINAKSVVQFFGTYPKGLSDRGRSKMGIYFVNLKRVVPLKSIKMLIRPFKKPDNFKGHAKAHARLDRRFLDLDGEE